MTSHLLIAALYLLAGTAPLLAAGPATTQASSQHIEALIARMGDDDYPTRERAQAALVDIGASALPQLRIALANSQDAEVRTRAAAAIHLIEQHENIGPTLITLHYKGVSLEHVFADLARQAKMDYALIPDDLFRADQFASVTIDIDRKPFWEAMKEVCGRRGLNLRYVYDQERFTLIKEEHVPLSGAATLAGPLIFSAYVEVYNSRPPVAEMVLPVRIEPRLRIAGGQVHIEKLTDDKGNSFVAANAAPLALTWFHDQEWITGLKLVPVPKSGTKLRMKGTATVAVEVNSETLEVDNILNVRNLARQVGGRRIEINELTYGRWKYELRLTLFRDNLPQRVWEEFKYPYNRMKLLDKDGKALLTSSSSGSDGGATAKFCQLYAAETAGKPAKLIWQITTKTRDVSVPFEFDDVRVR